MNSINEFKKKAISNYYNKVIKTTVNELDDVNKKERRFFILKF